MNNTGLKLNQVAKVAIIKKVAIAFFAVVIVGMGATIYHLLKKKSDNGFEYENNSIIGLMPGVDRAAMLKLMQENVDKTAIAFSINSVPTLDNSKMNISFENPFGNDKDLSLELFDNVTGDSIYKSKAVKAGSFLYTIPIDKKYTKGQYSITAYITAYDAQTHKAIGQAAAELKVQVI